MGMRMEPAMQKLRMSGIRMTPQRHAILDYLLDSKKHPSADEIYRALVARFPNISVATVYNNLRAFIDAGLIRELSYGNGYSRFDADMSAHYHAICEVCGKISDFDFPSLLAIEEAATEETGFVIKGHRLEVYGVCEECATITHH